jgi:FMN phosphatase YigB (HAD superfamily)
MIKELREKGLRVVAVSNASMPIKH